MIDCSRVTIPMKKGYRMEEKLSWVIFLDGIYGNPNDVEFFSHNLIEDVNNGTIKRALECAMTDRYRSMEAYADMDTDWFRDFYKCLWDKRFESVKDMANYLRKDCIVVGEEDIEESRYDGVMLSYAYMTLKRNLRDGCNALIKYNFKDKTLTVLKGSKMCLRKTESISDSYYKKSIVPLFTNRIVDEYGTFMEDYTFKDLKSMATAVTLGINRGKSVMLRNTSMEAERFIEDINMKEFNRKAFTKRRELSLKNIEQELYERDQKAIKSRRRMECAKQRV